MTTVPNTNPPAEPQILLITADQVMRALAVSALRSSGFRVRTVSMANEALHEASNARPDVVLLDLLVDDADALSFRQSLRALPRCQSTPVFVMSDLFDPGLIATVYSDSFSEFLPKPINWMVLPHRLRQAVVVGRSVAELSQYQEFLEQAKDAARSASTQALKLRNFDELTGLPNRSTFTEIVALAVSQIRDRQGEIAVLFIDIDGFKHLNGSLGRESGDALLRAIAGRLRTILEQRLSSGEDSSSGLRGSLARIHADEFAILLDRMGEGEEVERIAEEVLSAVMAPYNVTGRDVFVSASLGIAVASGNEGESVLQCAETAMRHAKRSGGKSICVYTDSMKDEVVERLELQERLRRAIQNDEFRLHYQPLVESHSGRIAGVEGLLRWTDPERGPISPTVFVPIAEEAGLVVSLGDWVLKEALSQLAKWTDKGLPPIRMAVNIARAQLEDANFVEKVQAVVQKSGIRPERLELELSERGVFRDDPVTLEKLRRLQKLGVTLAIDDFGTGQTTLAYLQNFPLSVLKIDRSFVTRLEDDPATEAIIRAMVAMSHELDLRVVGEGVETDRQAAMLCRLHCDELQGFLFHKPLPPDEIETQLKAQTQEPVSLERQAQVRKVTRSMTTGHEDVPFPQVEALGIEASHDDLFRLAHLDFLTDLSNRYSFERTLESTLARAQRFGHKVALVLFDLDQFKEINDTYGHSTGDELLATLARRMKRTIRQVDSLARLGGDEFALIHSEFQSLDGVATLAQRLGELLAQPVRLGAREVSVTASAGIAVYPPGDPNPQTFYRQADLALYKAKEEGGACFHFHAREMDRQVQLKLQLAKDLRRAIERGELHLVFQPQFSLASHSIVAVEALVRWQHPKRGLIPPGTFIPVAEDTGEILVIGEWILRQACAQAKAWQTMLGAKIPVSVNLSYIQFRRQDFPRQVERILTDTGLEPEYLELELNQRVLLRLENDLEKLTRELSAVGVALTVDDFGTSPFSIEDLSHLPFSKLKVDGRLIHASTDGETCPPLVRAVIALGKKLNLGIVAEALETQGQLAVLKEEGCDFGQGNYFTKPLTASALGTHLALVGMPAPGSGDTDVLTFPGKQKPRQG